MVNMSETVPGNMLPGKISPGKKLLVKKLKSRKLKFFEHTIIVIYYIAYNHSGAIGVPEIPQW